MISSHPPPQPQPRPQPQLSPRSGKAPSATTTNTTTMGLHGHRHHPTASSSSSSTTTIFNHNHNHTGSGTVHSHSSLTNKGNISSSNHGNANGTGSGNGSGSGNGNGSGTGNHNVLKRGDACLFCRKRKLKCDAVKPRCGQCTRLKKSPCEYDHSCDDNNTHNGSKRPQSQSQSQGNGTKAARQAFGSGSGSGSSGSSQSQSQSRARAAGKTETRGPGPNSNSQGANGTGPVVGMDLDRDLGTGMDLDMGLEMDMGRQRNVNDNINNQNILDYGFISATSTTTSMSAGTGAGAHALEAGGGAIGPLANGNRDNAENGNGSENRNILPDLALSPNSYEALTSLLQSMNGVDQNNNLDAGLGLSTSSTQNQMQMQMQMPLQAQMGIGPGMQMSTGLTPMPNLSTLNSLSFPFDLLTTSTFGGPDLDLSYAALGNQADFVANNNNNNNVNANVDARPNGMLGETRSNSACDPIVVTDLGKPWFFEKQPLKLLNDGSDRFGDYDAETQGGGSFTPSGFELVMDQAQAMVDDDLVRRRRSDTGGNTGGNSSMDAFRLPTSFRPGSDPTSGSASASGSGSGAGSAVPSPGSVINLSSLSPGAAGQTTTLTTAPTAEEIPAIFRERLLGSFMKQGRRFGLIYHWPTFWERMRGEEHLRPHPAWVNAMYAIGARGSEDPALRKMEKHFAQLAEEHFNSGLLAYSRITDLVRGATCLGMYNYWTAQYHKAWDMSGRASRLAVSSGLHQIPTGSLSKLRRTRLTAKHEEEPWIRRTTTFSLPPPNSEIELAERIHAFWQVFVVDRAGSVATQWNTVIEHDKITTPWPLPFEEYLNDKNVPVKDERMEDLTSGRMDPTPRSTTYQPLITSQVVLIERCAALLSMPPETTDMFGQTIDTSRQSAHDRYLAEISSARRVPQAHYRLENAIDALQARVPESMRNVASIVPLDGSQSMTMVNIDNCALQTRLLGAQIWLHDIDDWQFDNSRALSMARRMISITRLIPDHEFANLDGFMCITWTQAARVLLKELRRCTVKGDSKGIGEMNRDLDTLVSIFVKAGAGSALAASQVHRVLRWRTLDMNQPGCNVCSDVGPTGQCLACEASREAKGDEHGCRWGPCGDKWGWAKEKGL
ncbi:hypothetical protein FFLO_04160 [Filobasidium floriforme]|uniref:Zn(2)-C6 fungal-type domain-containing protein n=1 Tax=Filobasidium floriforme TaxID=5210 RepID=A0A8K0JPR1_9TREE|nr:hypothetical protein FFLO_04160 [Filobasidium floriforme]